jgi:insertion element IS1 protein InsB
LWDKIKTFSKGMIMSDYWKSYKEIIPSEQLLQSKAETYTVESYNGLLRHYLARFRRKTKCYSKSEDMIKYTLMLFMAKKNKLISIQN